MTECGMTAKADLLATAVCQGATLAMNLLHEGKGLIVATDTSPGLSQKRDG